MENLKKNLEKKKKFLLNQNFENQKKILILKNQIKKKF